MNIFDLAQSHDNIFDNIRMGDGLKQWYRDDPYFRGGKNLPKPVTLLHVTTETKHFIFSASGQRYGKRRKIRAIVATRLIKSTIRTIVHRRLVSEAFNQPYEGVSCIGAVNHIISLIVEYNIGVK